MKSIWSLIIFLNISALAQSFASNAFGAINVTGASYTYNSGAGTGTVTGTLSIPANATLGGQTVTITFSPPPGQSSGPGYTQVNGFTIN
jgi:hypothetical protein